MTRHVWRCSACDATGTAPDSPAAYVDGVEHFVETHDGAARIVVGVERG